MVNFISLPQQASKVKILVQYTIGILIPLCSEFK